MCVCVTVCHVQAGFLLGTKKPEVVTPDISIGRPFDFKHNVHVHLDATSPSGLAVCVSSVCV